MGRDRGGVKKPIGNRIELRPKRIAGWLATTALLLSSLSFGTRVFTDELGAVAYVFGDFFRVDFESNLPTTFSGALLLTAAILSFLLGLEKQSRGAPFARHWFGLGVLFLFMTVDELAEIHEMFNSVGIVLERLGWSGAYTGVFRWPWVLSGMVVVGFVSVRFIPFVLSLPARTRNFVILSGVMFVGGALGLEMVGALVINAVESTGEASPWPMIVSHIEETLEMLGVILFIYAVLDYANPVVISADGSNRQVVIEVGTAKAE